VTEAAGNLNRVLPTEQSYEATMAELGHHEGWFYDFVFSNGARTHTREDVRPIHDTRAELVFPRLEALLGPSWDDRTVIDLACHQGWFAFQAAVRGAGDVYGLDIRPEHITMAQAIRSVAAVPQIRFAEANLYDLAGDDRTYDVTLALGILYHLDDPLGALRIMRDLTGEATRSAKS
jgi:2-polyprenyl-3-methyl-5-hydroxy-6-metoxy-1,4-benzoquinol methylase